MIPLFRHFVGWLVGTFRSRADLMWRIWHCASNCWLSIPNDRGGDISDESRERCAQLFAELGKKIDRIAAYL